MKHSYNIAELMKSRRDSLGITQEALADFAKVGLRTIKELESGIGNPTLRTIQKIADALGLELTIITKKVNPDA